MKQNAQVRRAYTGQPDDDFVVDDWSNSEEYKDSAATEPINPAGYRA